MKYQILVELYEALGKTSKRLEKTYNVSQFLKNLGSVSREELDMIVLLLQGRLYPIWEEKKIGVADKIVLKAISISMGKTVEEIEKSWKKLGDLGDVAFVMTENKTQSTLFSEALSVKKVFENLRKLPNMEGSGSIDQKIKLISELLTSATPLESKFIVRTVLEDLRVGIAKGTMRDAIAWAYLTDPYYSEDDKKINPEDREEYNKITDAVQQGFNLTNDFTEVIISAKNGLDAVKSLKLNLGKPIQVMLGPKELTIKDAFERVGKPCAIEFKYDGFRMQAHKDGDEVRLFTRRLEDVTKQFPDVVKSILENVEVKRCILDGEAVGYDSKSGKYLQFQKISQRIKRKYNIESVAKEFPVEFNVFDIILYEDDVLLDVEYRKRFETLKKHIKNVPKKIVIAKHIETESESEAQEFFEEAVSLGNEGLMFKNLSGIYKPGARVGYMVKYKSEMDTIDLVITGAEWGEGKRSGWLTSFNLSCRDGDEYLEIGKVGTGIKELESEEGVTFEELTNLLKPLIKLEKGREVVVKPKVIIEIKFEEIQKSNTYSSGFALRFPRVVTIRYDRNENDIADLEFVEETYLMQK